MACSAPGELDHHEDVEREDEQQDPKDDRVVGGLERAVAAADAVVRPQAAEQPRR